MTPVTRTPRSAHGPAAIRLSGVVSELTRASIRIAREEARRTRLTLPQLILLAGLREMGKVPVTRWMDSVGLSPSAATHLLDGLEASGFVHRSHDSPDRREVLIALTPRGGRRAERLKRATRDRWAAYCQNIATSDLENAATTLERIVTEMGIGNRSGASRRDRGDRAPAGGLRRLGVPFRFPRSLPDPSTSRERGSPARADRSRSVPRQASAAEKGGKGRSHR